MGIYKTEYYNIGVSLGNYIIVNYHSSSDTIMHEIGHQKQSLYFGPLYLLLIGLPSLLGNILYRFYYFDYYSQPWESWADELGGVER